MEITMGLFLFVLFVFGAIVGSFLNVVILRHNTGKSLSGRSGCTICGESLSALELVPVFSYLFLKGKCNKCKSAISKQYILVELTTGILFTLSGWFVYVNSLPYITLLLLLTTMAIMVVLITYDFKHTILPDRYVYALALLGVLTVYSVYPSVYLLGWHLVGGLVTALPIFSLWFFSRGRAMGFGDVKLSVGIGIFLGVYLGISAIWYAFVLGAIYGLFLMYVKKAGFKSEIAFGPFLILGFLMALFTQTGFIELINSIIS